MILGRSVGEGGLFGAMGKSGRNNIWQRMARILYNLSEINGL